MPDASPRTAPRAWVLPVAVLAVAALLIGLALNLDRGEGAATGPATDDPGQEAPVATESPERPDLTVVERRDPADLLAAGPVDAPVVLIVFSDYQCRYCAQWSAETLPLMMERAAAGDLRIEWRDVNIFGADSERAARAGYAAAEQGAFWEYHGALFAGGETRPDGGLGEEALVALAGELGLDTERFAADLASERTAEQIARNQQIGLALGARSTPAFLLGGTPIMGAQPSQVFVDALDAALSAAR